MFSKCIDLLGTPPLGGVELLFMSHPGGGFVGVSHHLLPHILEFRRFRHKPAPGRHSYEGLNGHSTVWYWYLPKQD